MKSASRYLTTGLCVLGGYVACWAAGWQVGFNSGLMERAEAHIVLCREACASSCAQACPVLERISKEAKP